MARSNGAWGVEIGASGLKAIRLERNGDNATVTDFAVIRHAKVLTSPGLDVPAMVRNTLVQFVQAYQEQLKKDSVAVSLPGNQALARFVSLPPVDKKRIPEMLRYEAEQQIPFPIDEVEWDSQVFPSSNELEVRVGIFAVTKDRLRETLDLYAECGLFPSIVTLSPVAFYNAFVYDVQGGNASGTAALVDVGSASTDFISATNGNCYIRTFPIGGHHFTEAIAAAFKCPYQKAEAAKLAGATGKYAREVIRAMSGTYEQFIDELRRSVEHYQTINPDAHVRSVVGVGGTLRLTGLRKYVGGQINVEIARWDEFKRIRLEGEQAPDFAANTVNLATAYGLALQALGLSTIDINLIPVEVTRKTIWRAKVPAFAAAAVLGIIIGASLFLAPFIEASALGTGAVPQRVSAAESMASTKQSAIQSQLDRLQGSSSAAPYLSLLEEREVWPWIVSDSFQSLAAANPQPALVGSDPESIRSIAAKDRRLVSLEDLTGAYSFSSEKGERLVRVRLDVSLTQPEADAKRFLNDTVVAWLRANAKRDAAPYEIIIDEDSVIGTVASFSADGKASTGFGGAGNSGAGAGTNTGGGGFGSSQGGGGFGLSGASGDSSSDSSGGGGGAMQGKRKVEGGSVSTGGRGSLGGTAGGTTTGGSSAGTGDRPPGQGRSDPGSRGSAGSKAAESVDSLAPLPSAPSLLNPDDRVCKTTITFTVKLKGGAAQPTATEGESL